MRFNNLPVGSRGSSSMKSMLRGHLYFPRRVLHVLHDRLAQRVVAGDTRQRLHDRLDLLAHLVVGDAEHRDVGDLRVLVDATLDLGRVDVDPARDDHVALAVAEEQVARPR